MDKQEDSLSNRLAMKFLLILFFGLAVLFVWAYWDEIESGYDNWHFIVRQPGKHNLYDFNH